MVEIQLKNRRGNLAVSLRILCAHVAVDVYDEARSKPLACVQLPIKSVEVAGFEVAC